MKVVDRQSFSDVYPAGSYRFKVSVSTAARGWAAVLILPTGSGQGVQPDVISARRVGPGRWKQHQMGNGGGCHMPDRVRRDLGLYCY